MTDPKPAPRTLSRSRRLLFTGIVISLSLVLAFAALVALDLYWHKKFPVVPNYRGYRGPVAGRKQPNELRIVVLGGSTALGYGVLASEAFPAYLETDLRERLHRPVTVVNLAWNNQGAYSFLPTLQDYDYLDYDAAIFYEGYNDLGGPNKVLFRRESPVFRAVGYFPVIPMIVKEKMLMLRSGNLEKAYLDEGKKTVFRPDAKPDAAAAAALARQLEQERVESKSEDCNTSGFYCNSVKSAVAFARAKRKVVFVVTQPYINDRHREQQAELAAMLARRFPDPDVHRIDLGDAINLKDTSLVYDGMHLLPRGNQVIAARLADAIAPLFQ